MRALVRMLEQHAAPDCGTPGAGISANCWVNAVGSSILLWSLIFKALGLW